jgi:hypothetical protein
LRARIPFVVLQEGLCSVHAADALSTGRRRLCAVKVKLTIRVPIGASLIVSARSTLAGFLQVAGAVVSLAGSNRFGHRVSGSGMSSGCPRGKIGINKGGLSQSPPFFVFADTCCCKAGQLRSRRGA